mgnify:FL=1
MTANLRDKVQRTTRLKQHTLMRPEKSRTEIFPCRKSVMADFRGKVPVDIPYKNCKRIHTSFPDQDGCHIFKERLTVPSDERSLGDRAMERRQRRGGADIGKTELCYRYFTQLHDKNRPFIKQITSKPNS